MRDSRFIRWLDQARENIYLRKEHKLASQNYLARKAARKNRDYIPTKKVVESFLAPPSILLYVWAAFPLLFISTVEINPIIFGMIATIINFFLIHQDTHYFLRYIMSGVVLATLFILYHLNVI